MLKFSKRPDTWLGLCKLSPLNTHQSHRNHIVHNLLNVCSNHTTFKLQRTRIQNKQFAAYISDTPVTLKQSKPHQTWNDNVDPTQGYNYAKFERSHNNGVREKANVKGFFKQWNISVISDEMGRKKIVVRSWSTWRNQQSYKVSTWPGKNVEFSFETVWHCCDLEIQSWSLKVAWMGKAQQVLPSCKVWHLLYLHCLRKLQH